MVRVFTQRLQRADRHFIVVGGDGLNVFAAGHPVADHVNGVVTGKFSGLLLHDFDIRVLRHHLFDAFGAVTGRFIRQVAEQNGDVTFAVHRFG